MELISQIALSASQGVSPAPSFRFFAPFGSDGRPLYLVMEFTRNGEWETLATFVHLNNLQLVLDVIPHGFVPRLKADPYSKGGKCDAGVHTGFVRFHMTAFHTLSFDGESAYASMCIDNFVTGPEKFNGGLWKTHERLSRMISVLNLASSTYWAFVADWSATQPEDIAVYSFTMLGVIQPVSLLLPSEKHLGVFMFSGNGAPKGKVHEREISPPSWVNAYVDSCSKAWTVARVKLSKLSFSNSEEPYSLDLMGFHLSEQDFKVHAGRLAADALSLYRKLGGEPYEGTYVCCASV